MRLFEWYFIHCGFFKVSAFKAWSFTICDLHNCCIFKATCCTTCKFFLPTWITRTFSSLHQPTTSQWDDLESKVGNPFSTCLKQFSRLRKKHFRRWSINHTHTMYYVNIYFSYKDTFHYVLVSDTKVGKCWFREVTWPLALQKTFQEKSTMQSQKILSQRFMTDWNLKKLLCVNW